MRILFLCKHNRFRSKVAEAFARKIDKRNQYFSAGIKLDRLRPWPSEAASKIVRERGYFIRGKPKRLTKQMMNDADIIVIAADNVSRSWFRNFKGRILKWSIEDADASASKKVEKIIGEIEARVRKLMESINE